MKYSFISRGIEGYVLHIYNTFIHSSPPWKIFLRCILQFLTTVVDYIKIVVINKMDWFNEHLFIFIYFAINCMHGENDDKKYIYRFLCTVMILRKLSISSNFDLYIYIYIYIYIYTQYFIIYFCKYFCCTSHYHYWHTLLFLPCYILQFPMHAQFKIFIFSCSCNQWTVNAIKIQFSLERAIKIHLLSVLIRGEFIILIISNCTKTYFPKRKY